MEDAWAVALSLSTPRGPLDAFGVFDGLGGLPNGREAAWATALGLPAAIERSPGVEGLLDELNVETRRSRGTTTAVVAVAGPEPDVTVLSIGDSGAYVLDRGGDLRALAPRDADAHGHLTACLGTERVAGHLRRCRVGPGESLLLCSDGLDGVLGTRELVALLRATPAEMHARMREAIVAVVAAGAPDNVTAILARRKET